MLLLHLMRVEEMFGCMYIVYREKRRKKVLIVNLLADRCFTD